MIWQVHDFRQSLERSRSYSDAPWWRTIYKLAFPSMAEMILIRDDGWAQRGGIDRQIILESGRVVPVDEKVRDKDYGDILLERFSDEERKIPGWAQKPLACEFIAYAIAPRARCYLLPTLPLQRAWRCFGRKWIKDYPLEIRALNKGYVTLSTAVPPDELLKAIADVSCIDWQTQITPEAPEAPAIKVTSPRQLELPLPLLREVSHG